MLVANVYYASAWGIRTGQAPCNWPDCNHVRQGSEADGTQEAYVIIFSIFFIASLAAMTYGTRDRLNLCH